MNNTIPILTIALIALFGTFSEAAKAEKFPEFPYSKMMDVVTVANNMKVNGLPMRIYQFKTKEDEAHIVDFYKDEWDTEMTNVLFGDWRILSHKEKGYLMTVQIEQGDYPVTHGTLGITPMFEYIKGSGNKMKKATRSVGRDFPTLPNTKIMIDTEANEQGKRVRTILFSNSNSIDRNLNYYTTQMERKGWSMLAPDMFGKIRKKVPAIAMNKNGEKLNLSFVRQEGKTYGIAVSER
ncbi:hypothetical protein NBRC116583_00470 [Arenicella sp. 4NH20-0111]|uniref:hypothetical protein n=1 Tax=Arenicella sp. 4NH20-0111 TaxID=3127648 RepID=UPI003107A29B